MARTLDELHARTGDAGVFLDERGQRINGQWSGSPQPNEHDILTGSTGDGRVLTAMTCNGWMSDSPSVQAQVGHSDGLGPGGNAAPPFSSWNSSHSNMSCADTRLLPPKSVRRHTEPSSGLYSADFRQYTEGRFR
jgi:hypothetical protein